MKRDGQDSLEIRGKEAEEQEKRWKQEKIGGVGMGKRCFTKVKRVKVGDCEEGEELWTEQSVE